MGLTRLSRRRFLQSAGVTIAVTALPSGCARVQLGATPQRDWLAWIHIATHGVITVFCARVEMGQGILTAAALVIAEEMDAEWTSLRVAPAPLENRYGSYLTQSSASISSDWTMLRTLGASARLQLLRAAALRWGVDATSCATREGKVLHASSGRSLGYGELAVDAARLTPGEAPPLKRPEDFTLLGRAVPRLDALGLSDGTQQYTGDVSVPGMLHASIRHAPRLGATVAAIDAAAALRVQGVTRMVNLGDAVAVVARDSWSAQRGLQALQIEWNAPPTPALDAVTMWSQLRAALDQPGKRVITRGIATGGEFSRYFAVPFDTHATLEPTVCVAHVRTRGCEVWAPTQSPWSTYQVAREHGLAGLQRWRERITLKLTGSAGDSIKVHALPPGGSFGRRLDQDFVREAVLVSKAVQAPVKLQWSREEDLRHDQYRPASAHLVQAATDGAGRIVSWRHRIAGSGILDHGADFPYDCANVSVETSGHAVGVPTGSWRATANLPNAFARESSIDELAAQSGRDPIAYRLEMLNGRPRLAHVLRLAAEKAGWGEATKDLWRGVAIHPSHGSFVAQIVEVELPAGGAPRVRRVICAVDCGLVVNASTVRAQIEGGVMFGLGSVLYGAITIADGAVVQGNFDAYRLLRMGDAPLIDVHLVASAAAPGGVGEIGVSPIAAATANALFAATGRRLRRLPLLSDLGHELEEDGRTVQ